MRNTRKQQPNNGNRDAYEYVEEYESEEDNYDSDDYWFSSADEDDLGDYDDEVPAITEEQQAIKIRKRPNKYADRMVCWCQKTHYEVVKEVLRYRFDYHLTRRGRSDWDIAWWDGPPPINLIAKLQPWQRVNHVPGIFNLARKNMLGNHLMKMMKQFPDEYDFFPLTFMLPHDYKDFAALVGEKRNKTFICKPEASCQGKGIFLTRNPETLIK